mmetsp:Transcript_3134/g.10952  ORF Transcript_3134/g.10952 Transcript_3134/m.10952 type:complete len:371 (-) Transcript_3134:723-1835(-)
MREGRLLHVLLEYRLDVIVVVYELDVDLEVRSDLLEDVAQELVVGPVGHALIEPGQELRIDADDGIDVREDCGNVCLGAAWRGDEGLLGVLTVEASLEHLHEYLQGLEVLLLSGVDLARDVAACLHLLQHRPPLPPRQMAADDCLGHHERVVHARHLPLHAGDHDDDRSDDVIVLEHLASLAEETLLLHLHSPQERTPYAAELGDLRLPLRSSLSLQLVDGSLVAHHELAAETVQLRLATRQHVLHGDLELLLPLLPPLDLVDHVVRDLVHVHAGPLPAVLLRKRVHPPLPQLGLLLDHLLDGGRLLLLLHSLEVVGGHEALLASFVPRLPPCAGPCDDLEDVSLLDREVLRSSGAEWMRSAVEVLLLLP